MKPSVFMSRNYCNRGAVDNMEAINAIKEPITVKSEFVMNA